MKEIRLVGILIVCFALFGFMLGGVSAQEPPFVWNLKGGIYYMISPPYMPEDRDPQESLIDDLDPYDETQWRFFRYDPDLGGYAELKSADWNAAKHDLDFGRGYWIISLDEAVIDIEGEPIGEPVEKKIVLEHVGDGWNQIGNIFDYDFPIVSLYVVRSDDPDPRNNRVPLIDLASNDLTYVTLQEFENGGYVDIPAIGKTSLETGKAYWLKVEDGVDVDVDLWFVVGESSARSNEIYLSEDFLERVAQQEDPPDPPEGIEGPSSGSSSSSSGGCFIATAAYGDYHHAHVGLLRKFKHQYLLSNSFGKMLVGIYYRFSPALARFVANRELIKTLIRLNLTPIVGASAVLSKMNMCGLLIVWTSLFLSCFVSLRRRRGAWGKCKPKFSGKMREQKRSE